MGILNANKWLPSFRPDRHARLRLFCFPYAGGSARVFHSWKDLMPCEVDVCPIELPGRGSRIDEPLKDDFRALTESLFTSIRPFLDVEFAFFGHSMGALIGFDLACLIRAMQMPGPSFLLISGQKPPSRSEASHPVCSITDPVLAKELDRLNGTPREVLGNSHLMSMLLPILRADYTVIDTYHYSPQRPLSCGIVAFGGLNDPEVTRCDLNSWQAYTNSSLEVVMLPGDHFFIHSAQALLLRVISRTLNRSLNFHHE